MAYREALRQVFQEFKTYVRPIGGDPQQELEEYLRETGGVP